MGGMLNLSYPPCRFCHASPATNLQLVDKSYPLILKTTDLVVGHAGVAAGGPNDTLIQIVDGNGNEALLFQGCYVTGDAARMQAEEFGKIPVARKTAALIIERMNFHKENFFHERKLVGKPNFLRNPDALEVACWFLHVGILAEMFQIRYPQAQFTQLLAA